MFKVIDYRFEKEMENALLYLAGKLSKGNNNPKPVLMHSFRVGNNVYQNIADDETVIAAILHDVVENTATTYDMLEKDFGKNVRQLVEANSYDTTIENKYERAVEMYDRCAKLGLQALKIKCCDILDNYHYYFLIPKGEEKEILKSKVIYFCNISEDYLKEYAPFVELKCLLQTM